MPLQKKDCQTQQLCKERFCEPEEMEKVVQKPVRMFLWYLLTWVILDLGLRALKGLLLLSLGDPAHPGISMADKAS